MERKFKNSKGITLIALVITIIILIILAGVSINITLGEEGIITRTKQAKENMEIAVNEENEKLAELLEQIEVNTQISKNNKANAPVLLTGMTPIKFTMPTEDEMGTVETTTKTDSNWYEYGTTYETRRWANAQTQDGSMWVWIPRFAYKINNDTQTIDVVFLIGTTDNYYDEEGRLKTAQRQKEADEIIDTTLDFTVHPAFTNETAINYANGGWDKELTGIWVAKFEAGYASGNNDAKVEASKVNYSQSKVWVASVERPRNEDGTAKEDGSEDARNWLDGIYGATTTSIKYPTFQGTTYAMNYINHNDSYNIAKALTGENNIYGFDSTNTDSHLMKNSEWGAVSYLSQSIYGQNGKEITVNNVSLNSGGAARTETVGQAGVDSVYAITGCTTNETSRGGVVTTIAKIKAVTANTPTTDTYGIYVWNQKNGQNASTTGTIYGIYDLSGGTWERTASYVANSNSNLKTYGKSIAYENDTLKTASTKYTTVYPHNSTYDNTNISNTTDNLNIANQNNFASNTKIYGDAIRETTASTAGTSDDGWNNSSWNSDYSCFPGLYNPFFIRGGFFWVHSYAGSFAFNRINGYSYFNLGFRAVVVPSV